MPTRFIEYGGSGMLTKDVPVIPADQFIVEQSAITATGTSAQSAAVNAGTGLVIVDSDEQVYCSYGTNPTATTNSLRIPAGGRIEISVPPGRSWKIAVRT